MRLHAFAFPSLLFVLAASALPSAALAQEQEQKPANEQVVVPQVDRRDVKLPRFPSKDFELGVYTGTYATQNFGSSSVSGVRLGYHVTEDVFVEGVLGRTKVSDAVLRDVLGAGVLPSKSEKLTYYNISAGLNVLPGEVFIGRNNAKASALYLIGGIGSTNFASQRRQTVNFGLGLRVLMADWAALQVDMRDHVFSLDLLGKRQNTQNLELTAGLTFFF
jgi:outer membrane beta-barrel protein